jgi:uncharacterized membrane protein
VTPFRQAYEMNSSNSAMVLVVQVGGYEMLSQDRIHKIHMLSWTLFFVEHQFNNWVLLGFELLIICTAV